jgi:hypothetical protein
VTAKRFECAGQNSAYNAQNRLGAQHDTQMFLFANPDLNGSGRKSSAQTRNESDKGDRE